MVYLRICLGMAAVVLAILSLAMFARLLAFYLALQDFGQTLGDVLQSHPEVIFIDAGVGLGSLLAAIGCVAGALMARPSHS